MTSKAWRDLVIEEALEPELPIIDTHHHLWDEPRFPPFEIYPMEAIFADKTGSGHNVVATVFLDCHSHYRTTGPEHLRLVGETEFMNKVADEGQRRGGKCANTMAAIIPGCDLLDSQHTGEVLDAHLAASARVRGIRHSTAFDNSLEGNWGCPVGDVMTQPEFRKGFAELAKRDLTFDAWLLQTQIPELIALARDFPQTNIVLDHMGGPFVLGRYANRAKEGFADWKAAMKEIAKLPNVFLKIGGLNMRLTGLDASDRPRPRTSEETAAAQRDHILTAIDIFGPSRCMFETNFPVDMYSISYGVLWNTFKRVTAGFSPSERADIFAGTAKRVYRINLSN